MSSTVKIEKLADFEQYVGKEIFVSQWTLVTQEAVNQFAQATGDHQWIHVDVERAKRDSPFGGPIAHGFLTLSMIAGWADGGAFNLPDVRMSVNYGLNKVRFMSPVLVGSRLRARFTIASYEAIEGGAQIVTQVTIDIEGKDKPACVAETVARRYR
jgi:acyl dehydratase